VLGIVTTMSPPWSTRAHALRRPSRMRSKWLAITSISAASTGSFKSRLRWLRGFLKTPCAPVISLCIACRSASGWLSSRRGPLSALKGPSDHVGAVVVGCVARIFPHGDLNEQESLEDSGLKAAGVEDVETRLLDLRVQERARQHLPQADQLEVLIWVKRKARASTAGKVSGA
jgi:hypothetical protein